MSDARAETGGETLRTVTSVSLRDDLLRALAPRDRALTATESAADTESDSRVRTVHGATAERLFESVLSLEGRIYREVAGRRTLRFSCEAGSFFLKAYLGTSWREIVRTFASLRRPILGAANELRAIQRLEALGIGTMRVAGHGQRAGSPARRQSFLITDEIENAPSLEDFCRPWPDEPPPPRLRHALVRRVAEIVRGLHEGGVQHRDLYACHFLLDLGTVPPAVEHDTAPRLLVIDLHRALLRTRLGQRARRKDLAALAFSAADFGLRRTDFFRFVREYSRRSLREELGSALWSRTIARSRRLYRRTHGREATRLP